MKQPESELKARYGRGGFLGFPQSGTLRLTSNGLQFFPKNQMRPLFEISWREITSVGRSGYIVHFPLWLHIITFPVPLATQLLIWMLSPLVKNWVLIKANGTQFHFGVEHTDIFIESVQHQTNLIWRPA